MPNQGSVPLKETNNHLQGKSGSETVKKSGPATGGGDKGKNSTVSGGINRATKGS